MSSAQDNNLSGRHTLCSSVDPYLYDSLLMESMIVRRSSSSAYSVNGILKLSTAIISASQSRR